MIPIMNLLELKKHLATSPEKHVSLLLPDGALVPAHFHVTEAGHVRRDFVDCGGTRRTEETCLLQAWVAGDTSHRLTAGKLSSIFDHTRGVFPHEDLPVEIEYENPVISQFPVKTAEVSGDELIFQLGTKHTDCRAKERCSSEPDPARAASPCCGTTCCQ